MKTSTPYEILIRFDDKTGALKGAHFQTIETVTDDVTGAMLFQKPGDPQPLDMAGKLATDLLGSTVVSAIASNDDLKAQLAAAQKSATEAANAAAQDKETALAAKDAEIEKLKDEWNKADIDAALAEKAQKTAEDALAALRDGQAALARKAAEYHAAGDLEGLAEVIAEAGKDEAQRQQDAKDKRKAELQAELDALG